MKKKVSESVRPSARIRVNLLVRAPQWEINPFLVKKKFVDRIAKTKLVYIKLILKSILFEYFCLFVPLFLIIP